MRTIEDLARRFDSDRRQLKSVAFHLLGSAADAEDAVQSAIGELLNRSPEATKKLASRARGRLHAGGTAEPRRTADRELVPDDVPTELRGAKVVAEETRRFALRARAGVVVLVDGVPGIAIAPRGRVEALLQIGIEDGKIHTIDIVGDADRLKRAVLTLAQ